MFGSADNCDELRAARVPDRTVVFLNMNILCYMRSHSVILAIALTGSALLAGCNSDGPVTEPTEQEYAFRLVSPRTIPSTDAFGIVADTIVMERRDAAGNPVRGRTFAYLAVDGWVRQVGTDDWFRAGFVNSDSSGRFRFVWQLSASRTQHLRLTLQGTDSLTLSTTLPRSAALLAADTVVSSGAFAVCVQQQGRVGCLGTGRCTKCADTASLSRSLGRIHWFTFQSPVASISSNSDGVCALLTNGKTSCWNGLGPDSISRSDGSHPPFVELSGALGRTSDGVVWTKPGGSRRNAAWIRIPADSAIVHLLHQYDERTACGLAASRTLMCGSVFAASGIPEYAASAMRLVRDTTDNSVVRAAGGYTAQSATGNFGNTRVVVLRTDGATVSYSRSASDSTAWRTRGTTEEGLSQSNPSVRGCMPIFGMPCDEGSPWRSVSEAGLLTYSHINNPAGYLRTCGVRGVVVCYTRDATGQLVRSFAYQTRVTASLDTLRLAP
jgi:hypothetical protein